MIIKLGIVITGILFRLIFGIFGCDHVWQDATCVTPAICKECGESQGNPIGHYWLEATCDAPATCLNCGLTQGYPTGHSWKDATCTSPAVCAKCNITQGNPAGHDWLKATCTSPVTCSKCSTTRGNPVGHIWMEATFSKPQTCESCGETLGDPLAPNPWYINEINPVEKYGKIWSRSKTSIYSRYHTKKDTPSCWSDLSTPGQTIDVVKDNMGNIYRYGFHIDGEHISDYYISYSLQGAYSLFSGTCAFPGIVISDTYARQGSKCFYVYGDGELLYTSPTMRINSEPQTFEIDVSGVDILTIQYPATPGINEAATIFDGRMTYTSSSAATSTDSPNDPIIQDGVYYGRMKTWDRKRMKVELLQYDGRCELSYNYILNPTGKTHTLDILHSEIFLEYAWSEDYLEKKCESIDAALNTKLWGSDTTVREYLASDTIEIQFTVEKGAVKKIVILYAA